MRKETLPAVNVPRFDRTTVMYLLISGSRCGKWRLVVGDRGYLSEGSRPFIFIISITDIVQKYYHFPMTHFLYEWSHGPCIFSNRQ